MDFLTSTFGALAHWPLWAGCLVALGTFCAIGFVGAPFLVYAAALLALLWLAGAAWWWFLLALPPIVLFGVRPLRRAVISSRVFAFLRDGGFLPQISDTEREAIGAGSVWLEGELFSGKPDLRALSRSPYPDLSDAERAFVDGPVAQVCAMTSDWQVFQDKDLPPPVWDFLKKERFFGLIIPREYGGLAFSPSANSAVVTKLTSRSLALAITVMVPNSLGPAELLIHYGTEAQKKRWLPALACGDEIPCFALTEPGAGSDAGAIKASGEVFRGDDGRLMLRLQWDKRYITLAAIATVLGLAFKLRDPDELLGKGKDLGITCALIPASTPGVELGRRHDPMGVPFYNCPTQGHDVVVPLEEAVIGGRDGCGRGWQMLMECLAAGRGISLPATSTGGAQLVARAVGAYAAVRQQFGLPIGRFEGIEEPLARIAGFAYLLEAARRYTCGGLDQGQKPAVVTAMTKFHSTELWRQVINDGMDVMGGAAISRGPRNLLAHGYMGTPICITVEGANILTRTLMIFGQGAIRCHPFAFREIDALGRGDLVAFDRAFWGHIGHVVRNATRALLLSVTRGRLGRSPQGGAAAPYWRKLAWGSASFAFLADVAMGALGGDLKRREKVTGRFADVFSWLYLGSAVLRRFEAEGRKAEDLPLMRWAMEHALRQMQQGFDGLYQNLPVPGLGWLLRGPLALWSRLNPIGTGPSDRLGQKAARVLLQPGPQRDRLTPLVHLDEDPASGLGRLEHALALCSEAFAVQRRLKDAQKEGTIARGRPADVLQAALQQGLVSEAEAQLLRDAEKARQDAIAVDSFTLEEYRLQAGAMPDHADPAGIG